MSTASTASPFADPSIDIIFYRLDLVLDIPGVSLRGKVTVQAVVASDTLNSFTLDLSTTMTVDSVTSDGAHLAFARYTNGLSITLPQTFRSKELITVEIAYRGAPAASGFGSFVFGAHQGAPWVWSLSQPYGAREWWPCKDTPNDKADSVDVWITCPAGLRVGSNGRLLAVRDNGDGTRTHQWSERYPIAAYLVSVAVSNYEQFSNWFRFSATDSMEILNYVLPENLSVAIGVLPETVRMMEIFSARYGLYPFINEKYGHADFGWGGAMEHQTMTSTTTYDENTLAHELAHQWFGDLITCANWQELWLNEGFASYSEAVYREARYGPAAYRQQIAGDMAAALNAVGTLYVEDTADVRNLFAGSRVYAKGSTVLHMLRHVVGDSNFFSILRTYAADDRFRFSSATTRDFQTVCEEVTGKQLGYFFDQWVFGEKYPIYSFRWDVQRTDGGSEVAVILDQITRTGNPAFFTMPVDLKFSAPGRDTTVTLFHTSPGQMFTLPLPFVPEAMQFDPDNWILKEVREGGGLVPTHYALDQNYPNPFNAGTTIQFHVPVRSTVRLAVYDLLGQEVAILTDGRREPGIHAIPWNGTLASGAAVATGIYVARLSVDGFTESKKMIVLR